VPPKKVCGQKVLKGRKTETATKTKFKAAYLAGWVRDLKKTTGGKRNTSGLKEKAGAWRAAVGEQRRALAPEGTWKGEAGRG